MENEYGKCSKYVGKLDPISQRIAVKINSHLLYYEQIVEHINLMIDSNVSIVNEKISCFFLGNQRRIIKLIAFGWYII